jgi:hypothetical protein
MNINLCRQSLWWHTHRKLVEIDVKGLADAVMSVEAFIYGSLVNRRLIIRSD